MSFFSGAPVLRPAADPKRRRPLPIWLAGRRYRGASNLVMAWRVAGAMLCQGSVPPLAGGMVGAERLGGVIWLGMVVDEEE